MGSILIPGKKNLKFSSPEKGFISYDFKESDSEWIEVIRNFEYGNIYAVKECNSTMETIKDISGFDKNRAFLSLITQVQTGGRGQYNRKWISNSGNLSASINIPFVLKGVWTENFIPLILGNILSETFDEFGIKTFIKWPNDIIFKGKKLGGILVEKKEDLYIAGIGVNLRFAPDDSMLESDFSIPAVSLYEKGIKISSPLIFWQAFVENIYNFFNKRLAKEMPSDLISSLIQKLVWLGKEVWVRNPSGKVEKAVLKGLSDDGGLILERDGDKILMYSGSIRAVKNYLV